MLPLFTNYYYIARSNSFLIHSMYCDKLKHCIFDYTKNYFEILFFFFLEILKMFRVLIENLLNITYFIRAS